MKEKSAGFTLMEVLMVMAIIGVVSAIAVPALLDVLPNWRAKAAATDLFSNLQLAKGVAIRSGGDCVVTFSGNPDGGVPCQYHISVIDKTVSLQEVGSNVVFRGPPNLGIFPRFEGDDGSAVTWTLTFNSRGMGDGDMHVNFSSMKFADTDPKRTYYRAGATTAGVIHMQRYEGSAWQ